LTAIVIFITICPVGDDLQCLGPGETVLPIYRTTLPTQPLPDSETGRCPPFSSCSLRALLVKARPRTLSGVACRFGRTATAAPLAARRRWCEGAIDEEGCKPIVRRRSDCSGSLHGLTDDGLCDGSAPVCPSL